MPDLPLLPSLEILDSQCWRPDTARHHRQGGRPPLDSGTPTRYRSIAVAVALLAACLLLAIVYLLRVCYDVLLVGDRSLAIE